MIHDFNELMKIKLGAGKFLNARGCKIRVWLLFKGKQYRNRRLRILHNHAKKVAPKVVARLSQISDRFLRDIPQDYEWKGSSFPIPYKNPDPS